jgi:hypothetical protein
MITETGYVEPGEKKKRLLSDKLLSFVIGVIVIALAYYLGFKTATNIVGWINKENYVSPVPLVSAEGK